MVTQSTLSIDPFSLAEKYMPLYSFTDACKNNYHTINTHKTEVSKATQVATTTKDQQRTNKKKIANSLESDLRNCKGRSKGERVKKETETDADRRTEQRNSTKEQITESASETHPKRCRVNG